MLSGQCRNGTLRKCSVMPPRSTVSFSVTARQANSWFTILSLIHISVIVYGMLASVVWGVLYWAIRPLLGG